MHTNNNSNNVWRIESSNQTRIAAAKCEPLASKSRLKLPRKFTDRRSRELGIASYRIGSDSSKAGSSRKTKLRVSDDEEEDEAAKTTAKKAF